MNVPSPRSSTRRVPALRPSTRLISASASSRTRSLDRSTLGERAQARRARGARRRAPRPRRRAAAARGDECRCRARRRARRPSPSQRTRLSKSRSASKRRRPCSQLTKSNHSRSPTKTKGERSVAGRAAPRMAPRVKRYRWRSECEHRRHRGTASISARRDAHQASDAEMHDTK